MLYTVQTSYVNGRKWSITQKIEAENKETAKKIARENILREEKGSVIESQNVRLSKRNKN